MRERRAFPLTINRISLIKAHRLQLRLGVVVIVLFAAAIALVYFKQSRQGFERRARPDRPMDETVIRAWEGHFVRTHKIHSINDLSIRLWTEQFVYANISTVKKASNALSKCIRFFSRAPALLGPLRG
jgi:hypothetical protein